MDRPPGPRINLVLAVIGQLLPRLFPFDPLAFGLAVAREFGEIAHYSLGPLHVYQLSHPDFARQILVEQPEKFHKARLIKRAFRPFAGEGLLTSDGALWKRQRRLMHARATGFMVGDPESPQPRAPPHERPDARPWARLRGCRNMAPGADPR